MFGLDILKFQGITLKYLTSKDADFIHYSKTSEI